MQNFHICVCCVVIEGILGENWGKGGNAEASTCWILLPSSPPPAFFISFQAVLKVVREQGGGEEVILITFCLPIFPFPYIVVTWYTLLGIPRQTLSLSQLCETFLQESPLG